MTDPSPTPMGFNHQSGLKSGGIDAPLGPLASTRPANVRAARAPVAASVVPRAQYVNPQAEDETVSLAEALRNAPPWLISLVIHMSALILLGLSYVAVKVADPVEVQAVYGDQIGDQLLDNSVGLTTDTPDPKVDKAVYSPSDLPPVADPLAAPPLVTELSPMGVFGGSNQAIDAPIGLALSGREKGMKKALLGRYGGNKLTEDSVHLALEWLKRNQKSTGMWSLAGPYTDGGEEDQIAATAMALLAFQGAGNTPGVNGDPKYDYKPLMKKAWDALLKRQTREGQFTDKNMSSNHTMYAHAQASIALCELYGMTEDSFYRGPAMRAIDFIIQSQDAAGGWRYMPKSDSDTSVTGWCVMALQSARMAHLEVPSDTLANVSRYLDSAQGADGSQYYYKPGLHTNLAMTAEGLLCRQYLGWKHDDPRLIAGADFLSASPMSNAEINAYHWYYATQVMHHMGGKYWKKWNEVMRQYLPETQVKKGPEEGSWAPGSDRWGGAGGRLFVTCLRTYMLEVYYRHLPIYMDIYRGDASK